MRSKSRRARLWAWVFLLLAGLLPVHALADELLESCAVNYAHSHDNVPHNVQGCELPNTCHEHCPFVWSTVPSRANSVAAAIFADQPTPLLVLACVESDQGNELGAVVVLISRCASPSAYHQRVGLRLYA